MERVNNDMIIYVGTMRAETLKTKRLLLVKQIFRHGKVHKNSKSRLGRMLAIHHFDFAIEMFLKAIGAELKADIKPGLNFEKTWEVVNKKYFEKYGEELILKNEIKNLRRARNNVQHNAMVPSSEDLESFEAYTIAFFDHILNKIYRCSLSDIKLIEMIKCEKLAEYMNKAQEMLNREKYTISVLYSSEAFTYAEALAMKMLMGMDTNFGVTHSTSHLNSQNSEDIENIIKELNSLHEKIALLALNIDYSKYMKFIKKKIPTYHYWDDGTLIVEHLLSEPVFGTIEELRSKEDAEFCYNFVLDFIIDIEL